MGCARVCNINLGSHPIPGFVEYGCKSWQCIYKVIFKKKFMLRHWISFLAFVLNYFQEVSINLDWKKKWTNNVPWKTSMEKRKTMGSISARDGRNSDLFGMAWSRGQSRNWSGAGGTGRCLGIPQTTKSTSAKVLKYVFIWLSLPSEKCRGERK